MRPQTSLKEGQTSLRFGQTSISSLGQGGGAHPPAGHVWLLGKRADGSRVVLRGLVAARSHVKLSGKVS